MDFKNSFYKDKSKIRTDLALEAKEMVDADKAEKMEEKDILPNGMSVNTRETKHIAITEIEIKSEAAERKIGKKCGIYITLEMKNPSMDTKEMQSDAARALAREISKFIDGLNVPNPEILIIGLGNRNITADSLGPKVTDKIVVTRHVKNTNLEIDKRLGSVSAVSPGVMGITGIETSEIVGSLKDCINPNIIFVIDALASRSLSRVNATIQISDTGIVPGSGVGNHRMELSKEVLGVPVIAIGVPTVVDANTLIQDILSQGDYKCFKENDNKNSNEAQADEQDFIIENMVVTPKNIDIAVERISNVIASGLNVATHRGFEIDEINEYLI